VVTTRMSATIHSIADAARKPDAKDDAGGLQHEAMIVELRVQLEAMRQKVQVADRRRAGRSPRRRRQILAGLTQGVSCGCRLVARPRLASRAERGRQISAPLTLIARLRQIGRVEKLPLHFGADARDHARTDNLVALQRQAPCPRRTRGGRDQADVLVALAAIDGVG
jgi:hypothetical protein